MNEPQVIFTENSLTVVIEGKTETMSSSHPNWYRATEALRSEDYASLPALFDVETGIEDFTEGNITVKDGVLYYQDQEIHNHVVDRIFDFMRKGVPHKPLVKFLDKLMENPSKRAVDELYRFLENKSMPLTHDGNFVAYKSVTKGYKDHHSKTFDNSVGQELEMIRNTVCDDANIGCSEGFHAGAYDYAKSFGAQEDSVIMRVEINPKDVVSVPNDSGYQKLRTCRYKVVEECEHIMYEPIYGDDRLSVVNSEETDETDMLRHISDLLVQWTGVNRSNN
jgi:hypothetical protein